MNKKKAQQSIDCFFQRSVKLKTGQTIKVKPEPVIEADPIFPCTYPGCSVKCNNKGALTNHAKFKHSRSSASSTIFKFTTPIHSKPSIITAQFTTCAGYHMVSSASILTAVDYIHPVASSPCVCRATSEVRWSEIQ